MKVHEYQAKELLQYFNIPVHKGKTAFKASEIIPFMEDLGLDKCVLKAQVHAGGRGKGGGIKVANSPQEAHDIAEKMFGMKLVTPQTGEAGTIVQRILVTELVNVEQEFYAGIVLDRETGKLVFMVSKEGGVEIEKVAEETPEKITKVFIDPALGIQPFQARNLAFALGLKDDLLKSATKTFMNLYKAFTDKDLSLVEINPLVVTKEQELYALDLKINIDDNALFRHKDLIELRDTNEEDPLEVEASKYSLNYIKLDGQVGCMVNGAGLAMATMDIIKLAGSSPANFLDVGGGASVETVENGFRIILSDPNVKAILINIFGGIVRCDRVANGIIQATKNIGVNVPLVVRLSGTNSDIAKELLNESGLDIVVANDLSSAAQEIMNVLK